MGYDPLTASGPGQGLEHPASYWAATAGPEAADDGPAPARVDTAVAIIGGGYTGLSCALHLGLLHGVHSVVLEANRPGWGCSGRNGGFARMALGRYTAGEMVKRWGLATARRAFAETVASLDTVRGLLRDGRIACDASEAGHLKIAHLPQRAQALRDDARLLCEDFGYPARFLDAEVVRGQHIAGAQSHGALCIPDALALHPLRLAYGVLNKARAAGAAVHRASPVVHWRKDGATHVLTTPHGEVRAKAVVVATNGYTPPDLHASLKARLLPVLSHIIVTRPLSDAEIRDTNFVTGHVLTDTRKLLYYWRRLPDRRILFGGRGLITDTPHANDRQRDFLLAELKAKLPALESVTVDHNWHGWVCLTRDFLPHIHHVADDARVPSVHYALGYQGSGVAMSLHAGKLLARRVAGETEADPLPPFAAPLKRFALPGLMRMAQAGAYWWYRRQDRTS